MSLPISLQPDRHFPSEPNFTPRFANFFGAKQSASSQPHLLPRRFTPRSRNWLRVPSPLPKKIPNPSIRIGIKGSGICSLYAFLFEEKLQVAEIQEEGFALVIADLHVKVFVRKGNIIARGGYDPDHRFDVFEIRVAHIFHVGLVI